MAGSCADTTVYALEIPASDDTGILGMVHGYLLADVEFIINAQDDMSLLLDEVTRLRALADAAHAVTQPSEGHSQRDYFDEVCRIADILAQATADEEDQP
jgi:hypothetical protein